jgi:hypothetical protein
MFSRACRYRAVSEALELSGPWFAHRSVAGAAFNDSLGILVHPNVSADIDHAIANDGLREQRTRWSLLRRYRGSRSHLGVLERRDGGGPEIYTNQLAATCPTPYINIGYRHGDTLSTTSRCMMHKEVTYAERHGGQLALVDGLQRRH